MNFPDNLCRALLGFPPGHAFTMTPDSLLWVTPYGSLTVH